MSLVQIGRALHWKLHEDGQSAQRRLLLDLERQWLDSWRMADPSPDAAPERPRDGKPPEQRLSVLEPRDRAAASPSGPLRTDRASVAMPAAQCGPDPSCRASVGKQRDVDDQPHKSTTQLDRLERHPALAGADTVYAHVKVLEQPSAVGNAGTPSPTPVAAMPVSMAQPHAADDSESGLPVARRTHPSAQNAVDEQGLQRLTLRELSAHAVLAALRNSHFNAAESQRAAQGLVRALMEAGYARVQVVVNGQQAMAAAPSLAPANMPPPALPSASQDDPSQELRHGH